MKMLKWSWQPHIKHGPVEKDRDKFVDDGLSPEMLTVLRKTRAFGNLLPSSVSCLLVCCQVSHSPMFWLCYVGPSICWILPANLSESFSQGSLIDNVVLTDTLICGLWSRGKMMNRWWNDWNMCSHFEKLDTAHLQLTVRFVLITMARLLVQFNSANIVVTELFWDSFQFYWSSVDSLMLFLCNWPRVP